MKTITNEEYQLMVDLIDALLDICEHPEDSNEPYKLAIIDVARSNGFGFPNIERYNQDEN